MKIRRSQVLLAAALLLLSSCSAAKALDVTKQSVAKFHSNLNAGQFDQIYAEASQDYRKSVAADKHRKLFAAIQRKLGNARTYSVTGLNVNFNTAGEFVRMQCKTKFVKAETGEMFDFRVSGGVASLTFYNINSSAFLTE